LWDYEKTNTKKSPKTMNEKRARELLVGLIEPDGSLYGSSPNYLSWDPGDNALVTEGYQHLYVEKLEAIVWWIRNHSPETTIEKNTITKPQTQ